MKKKVISFSCIIFLILFLVPIQNTYAGGSIPTKAVERNGNYYYVYKDNISWEAAKENCEALGGHLAVITSASEQAFVNKLVDSKRYWLGGYKVSDQWKWVTGETWKFTDWYDDNGNYLIIVPSTSNAWTSSWDNSTYGYICEWEAEDVDTRLPVKVVLSSVKKASSSAVTLTWKNVSDAEGYCVYMKTGADGKYEKIANIDAGDITTYLKDKLEKGKTYYFRVRAYKTIYGEKSYGELSISKKIYLK